MNHVSGQISGVAAIYNRFQYQDEMREAVTKWEARLAALLKQTPINKTSHIGASVRVPSETSAVALPRRDSRRPQDRSPAF